MQCYWYIKPVVFAKLIYIKLYLGMIVLDVMLLSLLLVVISIFNIILAQVTYNQVQPLRINYLASSHRGI